MKGQVLHTVWCNISGEAAEEIWHWSLLGVKGLKDKKMVKRTGERSRSYLHEIVDLLPRLLDHGVPFVQIRFAVLEQTFSQT